MKCFCGYCDPVYDKKTCSFLMSSSSSNNHRPDGGTGHVFSLWGGWDLKVSAIYIKNSSMSIFAYKI